MSTLSLTYYPLIQPKILGEAFVLVEKAEGAGTARGRVGMIFN